MNRFLGISLLLLFATTAFGQPGLKAPKPAPAANENSELFRGLLHYHGVKPVTDAPLKGMRDTIVVILGHPFDVSNWTAELVRTTLADGGSVLLATRGELNLNAYFPRGKAAVITGSVECNVSANCLAGQRSFPLINDAWSPRNDGRPLGRIATNRPSVLQIHQLPDELSEFSLVFPEGSRFGFKSPEYNEPFAAGATGNALKPYRCMMLADQSVFSNQMLYASASDFRGVTPDNFRFANEVVKWLAADGTRSKCVFVENGKIQPRFDDFDFTALPPNLPKDFPLPPLPNPLERPIQETLAKTIDNGLANVEDNNALNRVFNRDNRFYGGLLGFVLIFAIAVVLVLFARRVWQSRHRPDYQPLPADPHMLGGNAPLGSFEHRRLELLRGGDFRGPVVAYLQRLFAERGLPANDRGRHLPPIDIRARNPRELKSMIRELWDEAFVFDREPLPYTRWKEIEPALAAVRSAADADLWQFRSAKTEDA